MKKILFILIFFILVLGRVWAGGEADSSSEQKISIMHNKVEIDAAMKSFAKVFEEETGVELIVKTCGGDSCSLETQLRADFNADEAPDIFAIDGVDGYRVWEKYIADLSNESWVSQTDVALSVDGKVVGFPVAIEGWGLAYNKDLLDRAGINPASLTTYAAYKMAFEKLDSMKNELGIDSVVSMSAGPGMHWVTSHHNFNSYLSNGLARDDLSIVNLGLSQKLDEKRFREYAMWVKLLFDYSEKSVLTTGDYDRQVGAFANQKAVFVHQGNWIEPNLQNAGADFVRAFAPQGSSSKPTDGIFVSAPSWYVVNSQGDVEAAKKFLQFMAESPEGHDYLVNQILAIPAFKNVTLEPSAPLSASILEWSKMGKTFAWNQYLFSGEFRDQKLGPIYEQLAKDAISLDEFISLVRTEFSVYEQ